MSLSNPQVIEKLRGNFIPCWSNSLRGELAVQMQAAFDPQVDVYENNAFYPAYFKKFPNGIGGSNIISFFCTPDGKIIHALKGYWEPGRFLEEIDFVLRVRDSILKDQGKWTADEIREKLIAAHRERAQILRKKRAENPKSNAVAESSACPSLILENREAVEVASVAQEALPPPDELLAQAHEAQIKAPLQDAEVTAEAWSPFRPTK